MPRQRPQIEFPDPILESQKIIQEAVKAVGDKIAEIQKSFGTYTNFVIGVLALGFVILLFALGTLLVQTIQFNTTFQTQSSQLKIQEELIQNNVKQQQILIDSQKQLLEEVDSIRKALVK